MHSLSIFISVPPCPAAELVGDLRCFQQHLNILKLNAYKRNSWHSSVVAHTLPVPIASLVSRNNRKVRTSFCPASPATNRPVPSRPPRNLPGAARPRCGSQALLRRSCEAAFIKLLDSLGRVGKFLCNRLCND